MKKLLLVSGIVLFLSSCASNATFHSFYKSNKDQSQFAIGTPAFVANAFIPKEELGEYKALLKKVRHYKVMVFEENSHVLNKNFNNFVKAQAYSSLIKINDNGEEIDFYYLKNDGLIKEMILRVRGDDEFVLLGIKTKLYEQELFEILDRANPQVSSK